MVEGRQGGRLADLRSLTYLTRQKELLGQRMCAVSRGWARQGMDPPLQHPEGASAANTLTSVDKTRS